MLYPKQEQIVNNLTRIYNTKDHISDGHLFISGEMGVGKTYMASALINRLHAKTALVSCPSAVAGKWVKVAKEFNPDLPVTLYQRSNPIPENGITVVKQKDLYELFKRLVIWGLDEKFGQKDAHKSQAKSLLDECHKDIANAASRDNEVLVDYNQVSQKIKNALMRPMPDGTYKKRYDIAIFDEVHLYQATHQDFTMLAVLALAPKQKMLGLTGTIFNQNLSKLAMLLSYTNYKIIKTQFGSITCSSDIESFGQEISDPFTFYQNYWRYIGAQIGLNQIKEQKTHEATSSQTVMPLKGLDLTDEQSAWQEIATRQLKYLNASKTQKDRLITSYLDLPTKHQQFLKRTVRLTLTHKEKEKKTLTNKSRQILLSSVGLQLTPIKLKETAKFKQLAKTLKDNPVKTLIFVQDKQLLSLLASVLPSTTYMPDDIKKEKVTNYLEDKFTKYQNVIATSRRVNVGIDVQEADNIIWYQVPEDVATIIQANRRVLRLGKKDPSKVWYLYYKNTTQEKIIKEVSASAVNNAAAYSTRLNDNLARVTHVLFAGI